VALVVGAMAAANFFISSCLARWVVGAIRAARAVGSQVVVARENLVVEDGSKAVNGELSGVIQSTGEVLETRK
jgi:hypothetical protein